MPIEDRPIINQWYRHLDKGYQFQVVMVDEREGTVQVQHFDGDLEELDLDTWNDLEIEIIEPPEDWSGPLQEKGETEERDEEEEEEGPEEQGQEEKYSE